MTEITCGVNSIPGDNYVGQSVNEIMADLRQELNIPEEAKVILNDQAIEDLQDTVLHESDTLEFVQQSGTKG